MLFPSWGGGRAAITAVRHDGRRIELGSRPLRLRGVRKFEIRSAHGGYQVVPFTAPQTATARATRVAPQSSNPLPGPSLAIRIDARRLSQLAARIRPARGGPLATP